MKHLINILNESAEDAPYHKHALDCIRAYHTNAPEPEKNAINHVFLIIYGMTLTEALLTRTAYETSPTCQNERLAEDAELHIQNYPTKTYQYQQDLEEAQFDAIAPSNARSI